MVIANFANEAQNSYTIGMPAGGFWKLRFNSDWHGYSELFASHPSGDIEAVAIPRDSLPFQATVSVAAYTALIYSR